MTFPGFDIPRFGQALEEKRVAMSLTGPQMMVDINRVNNHKSVPIALATVKSIVKRNDGTCQHVTHLLRWLDRSPESFIVGATVEEPMPFGPEGRLYWDLRLLTEAVEEGRAQEEMSWAELAALLSCSVSQVRDLRKRRYGISIHLAMRITQWREQPAADFIAVV